MISTLKWMNVGLRALMELGIIIALGYWGYTVGNSAAMKIFLAIAAPLIGFGFWGLVDFRSAGSLAEPLRLIQELVVTGLAAVAWYMAGGASEPAVSSHGGAVEDQVSLMDALRAAGAEVEPGDSIVQPFFAVKGQILKVNGADVQVFEYESAGTMEADAAQVSADGGSIGTSMITWVEAPHFFKAGRVLILYVGDDAAILDLLKGALGEQFAGR